MTIVIRIDYPERDPQAIKEALALDCEKYGLGVHVVEVRDDTARQESLWRDAKNDAEGNI